MINTRTIKEFFTNSEATASPRDIARDQFEPGKVVYESRNSHVYTGVYQGILVIIKQIKINTAFPLEHCLNERDNMTKLEQKKVPIVKLFGFCHDHDSYFFVMEQIRFGSLSDMLCHQDASFISMPTRCQMYADLAKAIKYLHAANFAHRDIKSANILIKEDFSVRLCDFGHTLDLSKDIQNYPIQFKGTPGYMAPEIGGHYHSAALSDPSVKATLLKRADIFSVAITAWELFHWRHAYSNRNNNIILILAAVDTGQREVITANITRNLANSIRRCWDHSPEKRPTARELSKLVTEEVKEIKQTLKPSKPSL